MRHGRQEAQAVLHVKDPAVLGQLKVGDKITFAVETIITSDVSKA